ncbi:MAG: 3-deoxy-manno-octulosonate cytidylyltransferase [Candidatus Auribacterota bacterium]|nr:3-deoxy-manno-octulosonate cytidylyltransferase [Candidatus Auribacterota bacterium]
MKTVIIIPERYNSERFPGKPLALIGQKPVVLWVCESASKAKRADELIVATDDKRIKEVVVNAGFTAVMTSCEHLSGTDRIAEAVSTLDCDIVVNLQGDEPFLEPEIIDTLIDRIYSNPSLQVVTAAVEITNKTEAKDSNIVKVVVDNENKALYFSRSMIPYYRNGAESGKWLKHLGIYCMKKKYLLEFIKMGQLPLEKAEKLEQLRILESGVDIYVQKVKYSGIGIDTPEDLKKALAFMENN